MKNYYKNVPNTLLISKYLQMTIPFSFPYILYIAAKFSIVVNPCKNLSRMDIKLKLINDLQFNTKIMQAIK